MVVCVLVVGVVCRAGVCPSPSGNGSRWRVRRAHRFDRSRRTQHQRVLSADRFGGSKVSAYNFIAMALGAARVLAAALAKSLPLYLIGFILLFIFSGLGNGSVYKMIPAIFRVKAATKIAAGADFDAESVESQKLSGALIGVAGAIGAFGGVLVNLAFRQSFLATKSANAAYIAFIVFYAVCFLVTYYVYIRKSQHSLEGV